MARRDTNLNIGITSTFDGRGVKSAEASAKAMERELDRIERQQRSRVQMQMQAEREMGAELQAQAEVRERLNERQRSAMESTGKWVLGLSAASAAGLALTAKAAIDWESAWAGVTKTVDGTEAELTSLEGELRRMARSLPATHTEIAAVAEAAGQLGVETENVAAFSKVMIDLGETTNLSADEAATALAQLMNIMGTSQDDVSRLGATIVALGNNSATTERDIVAMSQRIAGAGQLVGATEGEVLALATALASMGVTAELGGGVASRVLQRLYSSVQEGGEALQGFAEVAGVSSAEFARAFEDDPVRALALFAGGLNGVEAAGGNVITTLTDLGIRSTEEQRVLLQMKANTDLVTDSLDLQATAWDENIALIDEANQRYQTTEARLQVARNQINDAAIDIGGNFLPMVASATEVVGSMSTAFGMLPDPVKRWVTQLGTAATGVGLVGGAALIAVPKLHEFSQTVDALRGGSSRLGRAAGGLASVLTGPWGLALAGAVISVGIWAKAQGEAQQKVQSLADTLDEQSGALTANSTAWLQSELTKDQSFGIRNTQSMAEAAKEMGISLETLTQAYEGQPEAIAAAKAAASEWASENDNLLLSASSQADRFNRNLDDQAERLDAARRIQEEKLEIDGAATNQQEDLADATGLAGDAAGDAAAMQELLGEELGATAAEAEALQDALDAIVEAMRSLNEPTLSLIDAQMGWEATLDEINDQLEENGRQLDITTEKGRANQEFLNGMARDAMGLAEALLQESQSEVEFRASLMQSREALAETAQRFGMSEEAAWDYVNSVLSVPEVATTEVDAETGNARMSLNEYLLELDVAEGTVTINGEKVNAEQTLGELVGDIDEATGTVTINGEQLPAEVTLQGLLSLINGSQGVTDILGNDAEGRRLLEAFVAAINSAEGTVDVHANTQSAHAALNQLVQGIDGRTVTVYGRMRQLGQAEMADGGILQFYANGGVSENHVAQIAPAGTWRVWAEPETGGEAYIPLAPTKRARSEEILGDVAHRFGMYVGRYANGAVIGGTPSTSQSVPGIVNNIYGVPVDHAEETAAAIGWELRRLPGVTGYAGVSG